MKTKAQICFTVTAKLISAFVFATQIVQSFYFLYPKFQASSYLLWLYSLVCVGPGRKSGRPVFMQHGSYEAFKNPGESAGLVHSSQGLCCFFANMDICKRVQPKANIYQHRMPVPKGLCSRHDFYVCLVAAFMY